MSNLLSRVLEPIKREASEFYLLLLLIGFAGSVITTRLYLEFTGYPQLLHGQLHIAHVLWGGLLLFIASLLPLIFANRWAYKTGALLSGVGVGLFIDEVGKFITGTNDYFYPGAAPIIYAFFMLTVFLYTRIKRPTANDPRTELYHTLDTLEEVLDNDLDEKEYDELVARLERIRANKRYPMYARLAQDLLDFLESDAIQFTDEKPSVWEKLSIQLQHVEKRFVTRRVHKLILICGLVLFGFEAFNDLYTVIGSLASSAYFQSTVQMLFTTGKLSSNSNLPWYFGMLFLEGAVAVILLIAAFFISIGKDRRGVAIGDFGLLFSLTTTTLLSFYFDQFKAVIGALIQFILLIGILRYKRLYISKSKLGKRAKTNT